MPSEFQADCSKTLAAWANELACPVCRERLRFEASRIVCTGCDRIYPVIDGIPVLIADRAEQPK